MLSVFLAAPLSTLCRLKPVPGVWQFLWLRRSRAPLHSAVTGAFGTGTYSVLFVRMSPNKAKLSKAMTLTQFDNGYWYATDLKEFAEEIGIPLSSKLRKDELEKAINTFSRPVKLRALQSRRFRRQVSKTSNEG